ncbi:MAG: phosphate ABC transporter substrate-binding protein [Gammaproteobacteria bacterium]|nr:phosphate ABC transporter substrate-binding protein [Gammaproteobacteria bacterium]MBQ0841078.1 phosphate ABC transporter substrate-binding protein [Gammaproteobacteria bacterium]
MNYKNYKKLTRLALIAICLVVATAHSDVVVVVPADSPVSALSKKQVAKIFLGKSRRFPDGSRAVPVNQSESTALRNEFYFLVSGKSPAQVKAHWSKMIFTGRGQPPKEVGTDSAVKQQLAVSKSNIGYIDRGAVDASVKILAIQ